MSRLHSQASPGASASATNVVNTPKSARMNRNSYRRSPERDGLENPRSSSLTSGQRPQMIAVRKQKQEQTAKTFYNLDGDLGTIANSNFHANAHSSEVYAEFLSVHRCYDLVPTSTKVVSFDVELCVRKAFYALVYNGVRAAPLWDNAASHYVGMLTITDFIKILHKNYKNQSGRALDIESQTISQWKHACGWQNSRFVQIGCEESLYKAISILMEEKVHRLPVVNPATGNVLYILTHKRILKFLFLYLQDLPKPEFTSKTPRQLGIGTWNKLCVVHPDTELSDVLDIFVNHRVSALPVVDRQTGRIVDIYAKFDVINLAADKAYTDLHITVTQALAYRQEWFEGVNCAKEEDNLLAVIEMLVKAEVHRLIVTDKQHRVIGVVSLSDVLSYLVMTVQMNERHLSDCFETMESDSSEAL